MLGSVAQADAMKAHYRRDPLAVHATVARFDELIFGLLYGLDVPKMLEHAHPPDQVTLLLGSLRTNVPLAESVAIPERAKALTLYKAGFSIAFPAPKDVVELVTPPLMQDLGLFATDDTHDVRVVCARQGEALHWQFHRMETFVVQLKGQAQWQFKKGPVKSPVRCFHPGAKSRQDVEAYYKVHRMAGPQVSLLPPAEDDADVETVDMTHGSVLYLPAGTWFAVETQTDAFALEIRIHVTSYGDVMLDAVRQMLWTETKWRDGILQSDPKSARRHLADLMTDL